ncbi:uncharacterized protein [Ptychodera flava]|uniref:uncharacterized protein isoform X2 n=1 Tax=Ptychodera flava TaxID=63121 RepID=UPI00396A00B2
MMVALACGHTTVLPSRDAKASHASQTEFIYNADFLTKYGHLHPSIATTVYPNMGLTSDMDPVYQEYLILQSKTAKIDGFLLEWGYKGHPSDNALQSLIPLVKKHSPFKIGVNWCDHWLKMSLQNHTGSELVEAFHENAQYLFDGLFSLGSNNTVFLNSSPLIFLFGGGLTSQQFKEVLSKPFHLPSGVTSPLWLGSYLNFVSDGTWSKWKNLINGTFGWVPSRLRPTPSNMKHWDYYGNLQDTITYQTNVSSFGEECVKRKECIMWCGSVSPGFDNRGCAGWGSTLKYLPRTDLTNHTKLLYDAQWEAISQTEIDLVVVATLNDFPEATTILGVNGNNEILERTEFWSSQWKDLPSNPTGIELPTVWYTYMKTLQFYNKTRNLDVSEIFRILESVSMLISNGNYVVAEDILNYVVRSKVSEVEGKLRVTNIAMKVPSVDAYSVCDVIINGSYYINKTTGLYLQINESLAGRLRKENFQGYLQFQYQHLSSNFSSFQVYSSSKRKRQGTKYSTLSNFFGRSAISGDFIRTGDYAEVCNIMVKQQGVWQSARVELYKDNQSWDHTGYHGADLHFKTDQSPFLISNISLSFQIYSLKHK